jgi:hypothetical protein
MTTKTDFTDEEWARLVRAPFIAGMAISIADPGGPIEAFHETKATLDGVLSAATAEAGLANEIARSAADGAREHKNPFGGFKPSKGATASVEILDELRGVNRILSEKASAQDAEGVRAWLLDVARAAANAAKEGGFMGFHAERVSAGEERMLTSLGEALAAPPAS